MPDTTLPPSGPQAPPGHDRQAGPAQLLLLLAASCMPILGSVLIAPVLPQMAREFASVPGANVLVPVVLTVPALVIGLTAIFAGALADKVDRKRVLLVAMVGYSVVGTAPLYLDTLHSIVASRVLLGLFEAAIMTCCTTLIGDYWTGTRRARYLGMQVLTTTCAATVFLLAGGLLGAWGWRAPFWLYLAALVLVLPMAALLWQPRRSENEGSVRLPWRQLLGPCTVTLFGGVVFYALIVHLSYVLDGAGVTSTGTVGLISAVMSLATAVGAGLFGRVSAVTPRVLVPIEFGLSALGLGIVSAAPSVPVVITGAVITGFGTGLLLPTLVLWAINRLSFEQRGRGTGLWTGALFIGQFACPLVITGLGVAGADLRTALGLLGAVAAAMALLLVFTMRTRPRSRGAGY
ncbi:MFS transporter [Nocardiopsis sp. TSRI0078]|uniref:MFS transporter n=1 Tax=unclassified Nocardiopsis TaxID=2649073 RepID=UPI00093A9915|nr:MFS transporter [Nocardiopsis sp. TSRI0078]OKI15750.1 MFS transporter [Nocardiopsis sp. TSRI0078]